MEKIYIFGHRNPDTDSVTSAIALEYLKKSLGFFAEARVLGELNDETKFVLDKFGIKHPKYLNDVKLQIKDILYHKGLYQQETASIEDVYNYMEKNNTTGVPIVNFSLKVMDIVTAKSILKATFKTDQNHLYTSYDNIIKTLNGKEILKYDEEIEGKITAVTYKSTTFLETFNFTPEDILIVGDRHSIIEAAVMKKVKLLVITGDGTIKEEHIKIAMQNHVNIIKTPLGTFDTVRKIMLSNYIKNILTKERAYTVQENDYYDDFMEKSGKLGFNNYPVVDRKGNCKGLIRLTDINKKDRKKVILVDHNESIQSAIGLEEAEILEVIDHHKIGDISTNNPINFRNMAVGSTNTIIYFLYRENRIEIPPVIASLMLSGILSDTLALTSPTTTEKDKLVVLELEKISGLSYQEYAKELFNSGSSFDKKSDYELITTDVKSFQNNGKTFKVAQLITMNTESILKRQQNIIAELERFKELTHSDFAIFLLTDIMGHCSYLLHDNSSLTSSILERALDKEIYQGMKLEGVVSRKKQIIPLLMEVE